MHPHSKRNLLVDVFKAIAAQLIVLHHLATYGLLPLAAQEIIPSSITWLYEYGRIAVQIFLVLGGFLAARHLSPHGDALRISPFGLIWKRYLRLAIPYLAALGLAIVCSGLAGVWIEDPNISGGPTFLQLLAHIFLLQDLLGYESLSAGIWYIAIDFQLFALMALLLWAGRINFLARTLVLSAAVCSLFWFNRDPGWDNWGLYFFGSYALGAAAWWFSDRKLTPAYLGMLAIVAGAALAADFRLRIAVALVCALLLGISRRGRLFGKYQAAGSLSYLSRISYSVFLVHFPICLVFNALFVRFGYLSPAGGIIGLLAAWAATIAAAALFYRFIESSAARGRIAAATGCLLNDLLKQIPKLTHFLVRRT